MTTAVDANILDRVFYALAKSDSPEKILALFSTPEESERFDELAEKQKEFGLSERESLEMHSFHLAERYVRMAKAYAFAQIKGIDFE